MYRISKLSRTVYAKKITDIEDEVENLEAFINDGVPVILANELPEVAELLDIDENEIVVVEDED